MLPKHTFNNYNVKLSIKQWLLGLAVALIVLGSGIFLWEGSRQTADPIDPNNSIVGPVNDAGFISNLKDYICSRAGSACPLVKKIYWDISNSVISWIYLVPAILVAFVIFVVERKYSDKRRTVYRLSSFCFPKSILCHKSAKTDYRYYMSLLVVGPLLPVLSMVIPSTFIAAYLVEVYGVLNSTTPIGIQSVTWIDRILYMVFFLMVTDCAYFVFHYLFHKVPLLWEFHKVHHSAQVLTPVTALRLHPVDSIFQELFVGVTAGVFNGVYAIVYAEEITMYTVFNISILAFIYHLTSHLRHSHIWLHYGWTLSHVFSSPAQHQIHHSKEPRHIDKNFGLVLSIWDWMAGTLYVPRGKEQFSLGLRDREDEEYQTVLQCYLRPFIKVGGQFRGYRAVSSKGQKSQRG